MASTVLVCQGGEHFAHEMTEVVPKPTEGGDELVLIRSDLQVAAVGGNADLVRGVDEAAQKAHGDTEQLHTLFRQPLFRQLEHGPFSGLTAAIISAWLSNI